MRVGLYLPDLEYSLEAGTARWNQLRDMARLAAAVGFDSLWIADHFLSRLPQVATFGAWECWTLGTGVAQGQLWLDPTNMAGIEAFGPVLADLRS